MIKRGTTVLILTLFVLSIFGCTTQPVADNADPEIAPVNQAPVDQVPAEKGLQIVLKDPGMPEVKFLQPTVTEVQLQDSNSQWITIWSDPLGKPVKLTPDGAELLLDTVDVPAGTYLGTRMKVRTFDVQVDINRDGDVTDLNQQIILTLEEFQNLPAKDKPSPPAGQQPPQPPEKPSPPEKPQRITGDATTDTQDKPSKPAKPAEPQQPPEPQQPGMSSAGGQHPTPPYRIVDGLVYMPQYLNETHTVTLNDYIQPLGEQMWKTNFTYSGTGGKLLYDFTLHPLEPKGKQITLTVSAMP